MILEIIVTAIFIATIFNIILHKFKLPTIIGYILTGTIISYLFGLDNMAANYDLKTIAEFGIVFLMFTIGLEFSFKHLIKMKKNVFLFGSMQFFITTIVFYYLSTLLFGLEVKESIIIALGLTLSSTAIVLKILKENGGINKHYGNRSVGILIFQDLMVIPIMLLITVFSSTDTQIGILLGKTIISALILLFILWILAKFLLDHFLYKVAKTKSNEIFIGSILFIVIGSSALAHSLGFSYTLGAFLAGILIAETHYKHQVEA
ncbi:MAG: cation:proton antiporter, partial [Candidatus Gracilibacteria bacterium]